MIYQRINKTLSIYGICSRRKAELLIRDKKVLVNGIIATIGMKVDPEKDIIIVNGKRISKLKLKSQLLLLNKPKYVITSCSDNKGRKTILDLLPYQYQKGFFPIGRLDYQSRGALLITNDGDLCYKLSHPKFEHKKTYIVKLDKEIDNNSLDLWRSGVNLDGRDTLSCFIQLVSTNSQKTVLKIVMKEGRNRQIRRIAAHLGFKVKDLKRISFGNFSLGNLIEGDWKIVKSYPI
ncbi:MAG: pseudouridine synthase [Prochlorococcus sp. SP3034]|nr:pseudouridine synthase [Prochlorococcus sp. SP3034]